MIRTPRIVAHRARIWSSGALERRCRVDITHVHTIARMYRPVTSVMDVEPLRITELANELTQQIDTVDPLVSPSIRPVEYERARLKRWEWLVYIILS